MSGDYSRLTDRTRKRFAALLMQQGRVHLDSDWNELVDELTRRARMQSLDTFGKAAVPSTTPDGFKLTIPPGPPSPLDVTIGAGRCYVGGLVAEAFPGEQVDNLPLSYLHQPYLPSPPALSGSGLFYLDVWLREVTWLEDPDLLEVALGGIDTTTRIQTVWQVKFLGGSGANNQPPDCTTDLDALFPASAGRLTTRAVKPPAPDDPCLLPESGGFRGVENRLYRIEIHDGGPAKSATFKWSRENASVATVVQKIEAIGAASILTVERIGRDPVLRFQKDDWIEVQDDARELTGQAGVMARVMAVSEADRTLALDRLLPATFDATDPARHTRVRRWDQRAGVDPTTGVIPATSAIGTWFALEDGVEVQLSLDATATKQEFHVADSWSFAARTADASVEILTQAPPRAIEHRYAPLATLLPGPKLSDCRTPWPPPAGCECVCVTAESHASGALTLQAAVDQVIAAGGGKVCVGPGVFVIKTPVTIQGMVSVTLGGTGASSAIAYAGAGAAIEITDAGEVTIEDLTIANVVGGNLASTATVNAISAVNALVLRVERCSMLVQSPGRDKRPRGDGAAVLLRGLILECTVCDNIAIAVAGVASAAGEAPGSTYLLLGRASIEDNVFRGERDGIILDGFTVYAGNVTVRDNWILRADNAGITLHGAQLPSASGFAAGSFTIAGNHLEVPVGRGIVTSLTDVTIQDNALFGPLTSGGTGSQPGIALQGTLLAPVSDRCIIAQNRVFGSGGNAIEIDTQVLELTVRGNIVRRAAGGVVMTDDARAGAITVEGNEIANIQGAATTGAFGISLSRVQLGAIVRGNRLDGIVAAAGQPAAGILFTSCALSRAHGNFIETVGASAAQSGALPFWASLAAMPVFGDVDFADNVIFQVQAAGAGAAGAVSRWRGIWALTAVDTLAPLPKLNLLKLSNSSLVVFGNGDIVEVTAPTERASVRDNSVGTGENVLPLIEVNVQTDVTCTGNRVVLARGTSDTWAVRLTSGTLIVSSNRVDCGNLSAGDLDLRTSVPRTPLATVVGNVVHRAIVLNSAALPAPWLPLNILNA